MSKFEGKYENIHESKLARLYNMKHIETRKPKYLFLKKVHTKSN